jgi:hypothetical protein
MTVHEDPTPEKQPEVPAKEPKIPWYKKLGQALGNAIGQSKFGG